jgi:DNA-binding transcriptional ArsR family regulator
MARPFSHPAQQDITLDGVLYALSDPIRRAIMLKLLGCEGMSCSKAACTQISPSTISFHYKILRESGLVYSEKKGVEVINSVRGDDVESRFPGLLEAVLKHHQPLSK